MLKNSYLTNAHEILFTCKNLVFAGGGLRGIAVLGVLQALRDEFNVDFGFRLPFLKNVVGVSIGCLYALVICLGFSVSEITNLSSKMNQTDILNPDPLRLITGELSVDSGKKLKEFIENVLKIKNFSETCTFIELYNKTNINFEVVVTNLSLGSIEYINKDTYPTLKVSDGICASMALPLVFPPVESPNKHVWIDGGVLENYPILKFNANESIGIDFGWKLENQVFNNLPRFLLRIIQVMQVPSEIASWSLLTEEHKFRTIKIHTGVSSALEAALTQKEVDINVRLQLQKSGYDATKEKIIIWKNQKIFENNVIYDPGDQFQNRILPSYLYKCKHVNAGFSNKIRKSKKNNIINDER